MNTKILLEKGADGLYIAQGFVHLLEDNLLILLAKIVEAAHTLNTERHMCVIVVIYAKTGELEFIVEVGPRGENPPIRYYYNAVEKAHRLFKNLNKGHITSAESADMKNSFPGAVLAGDFIISTSGQNMWLDEGISTHIGIRHPTMSFEQKTKLLTFVKERSRYSEIKKAIKSL